MGGSRFDEAAAEMLARTALLTALLAGCLCSASAKLEKRYIFAMGKCSSLPGADPPEDGAIRMHGSGTDTAPSSPRSNRGTVRRLPRCVPADAAFAGGEWFLLVN